MVRLLLFSIAILGVNMAYGFIPQDTTTIHLTCGPTKLVDSLRPTYIVDGQVKDSIEIKNLDPSTIEQVDVTKDDIKYPHGVINIITRPYALSTFRLKVKKVAPQIYRKIEFLSYKKLYQKYCIKIIDGEKTYDNITYLVDIKPERIKEITITRRKEAKKSLQIILTSQK
ncbi:hypothetical protein [Butyricimonas paravirosa]